MTEAALDSGGVSTPAEPTGAPLDTAPVDIPNALGSQTPTSEQPEAEAKPEVSKTAGEAVRKAMDAVKAREAEKGDDGKPKPEEPKAKDAKAQPEVKAEPVKAEAKPETKPTERAPDGKFAPKATEAPAEGTQPAVDAPAQTEQGKQSNIHEAPARFDAAAKAEWANAPESVKGAVHRTVRELEQGIEEHRQRWEPLRQYDELAKQNGTELSPALERYVAMDKLLSHDLAQGLDSVIRDKTGGQMGLREFVAQLTGQQPDQAQSQSDRTTHELRQQISRLEQQLQGVTGHIQQQTAAGIEQKVGSFSADKPDFEALSGKIVEHIGKGLSLEAAYEAAKQEATELARSLGYVPAASQTQQPLSPAQTPAPAPLKPAGQKSVHGAPATGSDPASQKKPPASSIREALERAKSRVA